MGDRAQQEAAQVELDLSMRQSLGISRSLGGELGGSLKSHVSMLEQKPQQSGLYGQHDQVGKARRDTVRHRFLSLLASRAAASPPVYLQCCPQSHCHSPPAHNLRPWVGRGPKTIPGPTPCIQEKTGPGGDHPPQWR